MKPMAGESQLPNPLTQREWNQPSRQVQPVGTAGSTPGTVSDTPY
jgi:hypothetical protein